METTTQEAQPGSAQELVNRQTGIREWSKFADRAIVTEREPDDAPPQHAENALKDLSHRQLDKWRETGKTPAKDAERQEAAPKDGPANPLKDLTHEERKTWREKGELPASRPSAAKPEAAKPAATPEQHDQRYEEFRTAAQNDAEVYRDLGNIKLDAERGTIFVHALADLPNDTRRQVIKTLASRPDLQQGILNTQTREQVVAAVQKMAGGVRTQPLTPEQEQHINGQMNDLEKRYPGAADKIRAAARSIHQDPQIPIGIKQYLEHSEVLTHVLYALSSKQIGKFIQQARNDPREAMKTLVILERETEQQLEARERPPVTRAPKPVSEVGGRGTTPVDAALAEAKANPGKLTRSAKAEMDRQFAARHRD